MAKPIWELDPEEIGLEMARPNKRVPRSTELTRLEEKIAMLPVPDAVPEPEDIEGALGEFEVGGDTMFTPNAWLDQPDASNAADGTEITSPPNAAIVTTAVKAVSMPFSPPTAKISRDELEVLRAQLKGVDKKK